MTLWLQISPGSDEPIYAQIVGQISRAIATGELAPGDKLPAVRRLAGELVINPNTVARAYRLLEQQGLVSTKTGSGTYAADPALRGTDAGRLNVLAERMDNIVAQAINLGLRPGQITGMFEARLRQFSEKSAEKDTK